MSFGHKHNNTKFDEPLAKNDQEQIKVEGDDIKYLFENLNLTIEAGTTNAIVGPSGFGKTSMLHLLFRIYDPNSGEVVIDGQNIKNLTFESFRKHIVVVPQNGILFNDTIEQNLKYGNPNATQEELEVVARQCSIHDGIM